MSTLRQRWDEYQERSADAQEMEDSFAVRGDGALVIFDREGYFLIVWAGPGIPPGTSESVENLLMLEDRQGNREPFHCQPIWIAGYYEIMQDYLYER